MNIVALIGRMCADAELKYLPSGVAVANFNIAVNRQFKKEGEQQTADFFPVVCFKHSAEYISKYGKKGMSISVNGRLQQRSWVQQDGTKRSVIEVMAENITLLEKRSENGDQRQGTANNNAGQDDDYDPFASDD